MDTKQAIEQTKNDNMLEAITSNGSKKTLPDASNPGLQTAEYNTLKDMADILTELAGKHYRLAAKVVKSKRAYKYHTSQANELSAAADRLNGVTKTVPADFS